MSITKNISKTKIASGAALVALSGFVPQPFMQQAEAATATVTVTGKLITGVRLTNGTSVKFGTLAPTAPNGTAIVGTGGTIGTISNAVKVGANSQAGTIVLKVASTTIGIDVTVGSTAGGPNAGTKALGAVTLAATAGGAGPTGTVKINKILMGNAFAVAPSASFTVTDGGGGSAKQTGVKGAAATGTINVGAQITWGATQPLGNFSEQILVQMSF